MGSRIFSYGLWAIVLLFAIFAFFLMQNASDGESAIMDELAHIPAGYGYVRHLDFRLNPEHPPLVKVLAAIPLRFMDIAFPTNHRAWDKDVNGQWDMGGQLLYENGNDADRIIRWSRVGPMLLTVALILFVYFWSTQILGRVWALAPTFLTAFSPNILGHGHYVTTDIAAALGIMVGTYFFLRYLFFPSRKTLVCAGVAFGFAQLTKFSAVLLIPYFLFLSFVFVAAHLLRAQGAASGLARFRIAFREFLKKFGGVFAVFAIGSMLVIYPAYAVLTVNYPLARQAAETEFLLSSFAGGPTPPGKLCTPVRCLADLNIWMSKHHLTRPLAHYSLGVLMVIQRAAGGNNNYFLGHVSSVGSRLYFPTVYLIKEPLPVVLLVLIALLARAGRIARQLYRLGRRAGGALLDYLGTHFTEFALFIFVAFYWAYSMKSPLNIGFRHLFPTIPFIYILLGGFWREWITTFRIPPAESLWHALWMSMKTIFRSSMKYVLFISLMIWFFLETLLASPYYLSYFNQLAGGVSGGYRYVTDSNYDWGQDLLRLRDFVRAHPEIKKIAVDYFGGGNPRYYLGKDKAENWWSARGNPKEKGIAWLAVSVNSLQGAIQPTAPGFDRKPEDEYRWLLEARPAPAGRGKLPEPDFRAGTSIFIYRF